MSKQRVLIKIGGNALGRDDTTVADLVSLQNQGYGPVVVHGGGKTITEWLERMDVPTRFVEGLRVTGWPMATVVRGRVVMREAELQGDPVGAPIEFWETLQPEEDDG